MRFFFADSFDVVDPSFDFDAESRSRERVRHRSDTYAHELFTGRPTTGFSSRRESSTPDAIASRSATGCF